MSTPAASSPQSASATPTTIPASALPEPWGQLLAEGQVLTALLLSTSFSEKYNGAKMSVGDVAEVRLPRAAPAPLLGEATALRPLPATELAAPSPPLAPTVSPTLLAKAGSWQASVDIWLGDGAAGDRTIYVAFGPLFKKRQFRRIIQGGAELEEEPEEFKDEGARQSDDLPEELKNDIIQNGAELENEELKAGDDSPASFLRMSKHVSRLLQTLWDSEGLRGKLDAAVAANPGHRVIFAGLSHGASLSQAAALQFRLWRGPFKEACNASPEVLCVSWNGYKWTDAAGAALAERAFGSRMLPMVLSRGKAKDFRCDAVPGFPRTLDAMPGVVFLDADDGTLLPCDGEYEKARVNPSNALRMKELHFAKQAISGTRAAMKRAIGCDIHEGANMTISSVSSAASARRSHRSSLRCMACLGPDKSV